MQQLILLYFFSPLRPAFFANISFFAAKRFGDLYGRLVFLLGLNEINRVMAHIVYYFSFYGSW
jgi:hypothetical protein